jgi:hypothetical protein
MSSTAFDLGTPTLSPSIESRGSGNPGGTGKLVAPYCEVRTGTQSGGSGGGAIVTRLIPTSFTRALADLQGETGLPNWADDNEEPIAPSEWEWAAEFVREFLDQEFWGALPVPAPCGDGSVHLTWSGPDQRRFVLERKGGRLFFSQRNAGGVHSVGELSSDSDAISQIRNFLV